MSHVNKRRNVKRDTNAFVMLSDPYIYGELDNALLDGSFTLSENNLPVVLDLIKTK